MESYFFLSVYRKEIIITAEACALIALIHSVALLCFYINQEVMVAEASLLCPFVNKALLHLLLSSLLPSGGALWKYRQYTLTAYSVLQSHYFFNM